MGIQDPTADQDRHFLIPKEPDTIEFLFAPEGKIILGKHPVFANFVYCDAGRIFEAGCYFSFMMTVSVLKTKASSVP